MRAPPAWIFLALGVGLYLYSKRGTAQQVPTRDSRGVAVPYTPVPTFRAEWAGADLYAQTGSVLPSGASRELIR